jgi:hypothetical protein
MKYVLFVLLTLFVGQVFSQSIMKPVPKPGTVSFRAAANLKANDSLLTAFRPTAVITGYGFPGNILMAGVGISWEHLKYDFVKMKWVSRYSIAAVGMAGGSVAPQTVAAITTVAILVGILNNAVNAGVGYNGNKLLAVVSVRINLIN